MKISGGYNNVSHTVSEKMRFFEYPIRQRISFDKIQCCHYTAAAACLIAKRSKFDVRIKNFKMPIVA